ncbi:MAG TPA: hypothetical protein PKE26_07760 [Kiritimatiellia bacterium]|nr:hypothetical protein [Kiritimatiellia bacterium]HMO98987.1 hypothetical protein [Kiritimatiellia bacterium]HMP96698.1 hypothetical protein [Kiritimatiellia bacterium]
MWQPLSKLLNLVGRLRIPGRPKRVELIIGNPAERDAMDATYWKNYQETEALFAVWGPPPGSPWEPYHCVPLFAALQTVKPDRIGPTAPDRVIETEGNGQLGVHLNTKPLGEAWAAQRSWVILDLPGAKSVPAALRLMAGGFQPVCTFDNWPHPAGLVKSEIVLAQLLRYAALAGDTRKHLATTSPPVWVCDRNRLGSGPARPRDFDNRYYLDDSILPSGETLRKNGIEQILCVVPTTDDLPRDDLRAYFRDLRKEGFAAIYRVGFSDPTLRAGAFPESMYEVKFSTSGYARSDAGGFGMLIPEPSSSGG